MRWNLLRCAAGNARVINCDWLAPITTGSLHALIANPPYIPDADPHLEQGDLPREPRSALAAGPDGLNAIRELSTQAATRLSPGGLIALEHGYDQGTAVRSILAELGFLEVSTRRDLAGHERATTGVLPG